LSIKATTKDEDELALMKKELTDRKMAKPQPDSANDFNDRDIVVVDESETKEEDNPFKVKAKVLAEKAKQVEEEMKKKYDERLERMERLKKKKDLSPTPAK